MTYTLTVPGNMGALSVGARDTKEAVAKAHELMADGSTVVIKDADGKVCDLHELELAVQGVRWNR